MSTLDETARHHVARSRFGIPPKNGEPGKYPMPDAEHAANAKARAAQQLKAGNLSQAEYSRIVAMANRILGSGHHS